MTPPRTAGIELFAEFVIEPNTRVDSQFQATIEQIDSTLRAKHGLQPEQSAVGVLDLEALRLAMVRPDLLMYAASIPKIAILLAFIENNPAVVKQLAADTRHDLGLIIKKSNDELATRYSRRIGLREVQRVLNAYGFYDSRNGGGIWMGKHYGDNCERIGDPIGNHSHAVNVRQLLRFYLLLEQGKMVSQDASACMREIFASPAIPHDPIKFVKSLAGRDLQILRKWGSWEDWLHDSAIVRGPDRHYVLVGLTHHPAGDDYLTELAATVDSCLQR